MPNILALCSLQLYLKPKVLRRVLQEAAEVLEAQTPTDLYQYLKTFPSIPVPPQPMLQKSWDTAQKNEQRYQEHGIHIWPFWSASFPPIPVPLLYLQGQRSVVQNTPIVAVIGARKASPLGLQAAHRIAVRLGEEDMVVLSGLAKGCDVHAHLGALATDRPTIAVLAHGLHTVYPTEHRDIARRITQRGCLISEHPWGVSPNRGAFIQRNRWQVALSHAIILIESSKLGGSMHTIRFARQSQKHYRCFWHANPTWQKSAQGNRCLMEEGTKTIACEEDIQAFVQEISNIRTQN